MLLNKHKNYILVGLTALGVVVTVAMLVFTSTIELFGGGKMGPNQFSSYGMVNAKTVANASSNGVKAETVTFEFDSEEASLDSNGFSTLGRSLENANEEEPSIFNVHGVGNGDRDIEFLFESLSPTDYQSTVFQKAYVPFTRMVNARGLDNVTYLSTIDESGARRVTVEVSSNDDTVEGKEVESLWRTMLTILSPIAENTSYDLTLNSAAGVTVHGTLSTEAEQKQMMEIDASSNWDAVFGLLEYGGVSNIDLYVQGHDKGNNTVALTVAPPASVPDFVANMKAYASNLENMFPRDFTTTITVEGESVPAHTFYPGR